MAACPATASSARPAFLPPSVDFDALPARVRQALVFVVEPVYEELVVGACSAAERAAGSALVLLTSLEVIQQFALAQATDFTTLAAETDEHRLAREKLVRAHLRLARHKLRVAGIVFRLQRQRTAPPPPVLTPLDRLLASLPAETFLSRNGESDDQHGPAGGDPPCRRPPQCVPATGSCSADSSRHSSERHAQTQPWAGLQPRAAVSRRPAGPDPRGKKFCEIAILLNKSAGRVLAHGWAGRAPPCLTGG